MKALTISEVQKRQLLILDYISEFCESHKISYVLIGGALLGAYREGKLIPWDDDIDIFMLRGDYERFVSEFQDTEQYALIDSSRHEEYYYPFAKVCDTATRVEENVESLGFKSLHCIGVCVDVFPIDRLTSSVIKTGWALLHQRALQGLCYRDFRYEDPGQIPLCIRAVLSVYKALMKIDAHRVDDYIKLMGGLWTPSANGDRVVDTWTYQQYSFDALFPAGSIELEGKCYSAPNDCAKFLEECYGSDYMIPRNTQPDGHGVAYVL